MSIVAISETAGSLGNEIGRRLAERLRYRFADREIIAKAAERFGGNIHDLRHAAEEKPTLRERWTEPRGRYQAYIEAVILELATGDDVVLAGLASTIVLRPVAHALRVRIDAPEAVRVERVEQHHGLTREAALYHVRQSDQERRARVKFLYHVAVDDPLLYDLVLNTERLPADEGARLVQEALLGPRLRTAAASRRELVDLGLAAGAKAAFMANPVIGARRLSVSARGGHVHLSGSVEAEDERKLAQSIVEGMPGVAGVRNEIVAVSRGR